MSLVVQRSELQALVKSPLWELNAKNVAPPPQFDFTVVYARANSWGCRNFQTTYGTPLINGTRYRTFTTTCVITFQDFTEQTVTGVMTIDALNGSIVSKSITPSPPDKAILASGTSGAPTDINVDGTVAEWKFNGTTNQSITLSDPHTLGDLTADVTALLDAYASSANLMDDLTAGNIYETAYEIAVPGNLSAGGNPFEYWVALWTESGGSLVGAWYNPGTNQTVLDSDLPAHVTPATYLDQTPWSPGLKGTAEGPGTYVLFNQGTDGPMLWQASRLLVQRLTALSDHCATEFYDANAQAAGNSDNAFTVSADGSGRIKLDEAQLLVNSGLSDERGDRWLYLQYHPSGITCVP